MVFDKPEYFFRPTQLLRRLARRRVPKDGKRRRLELPWGLDLDVRVDETIGHAVWHLGVYDLVVSEALWRLCDPGERAADVGANIGHMSSLLTRRLGDGGLVTSFEPLPALFRELEENAGRWSKRARVAKIVCEPVALSDRTGTAELVLPEKFDTNSGIAYLKGTRPESAGKIVEIRTRTLDERFDEASAPRVMKVDVEGAELRVFMGGDKLLRSGAVRDVVFEENERFPTAATRKLEELGFKLFRLEKTFFGPVLVDPTSPTKPGPWEPPNYLATKDVERAKLRFGPRGWRCLRHQG
jgi:FkbM family methyltransferase